VITIHHRTGPLAGQEQSIDDRYDRITIGRDPDVCDVVFPPETTIVARRHFALVRRPSGQWTFDLFGSPFVAVNGEPADMGQPLRDGAVIELGRRGGPTFELRLDVTPTASQLPVTDPQEPVESLHAATDRARKGSAGARRMALIGVGVASVAAVGTVATFWSNRGQDQQLQQAIAALDAAQARTAASMISPAVREKLVSAAYLVTVRYANGNEVAQGTASPIAPDLLATNAHVAALRDELRPGDRMFVRAPGSNGRVHEVIATKPHAAYTSFKQFLAGPDPLFVNGRQLSASAAYDVATLRVAPGANLTPILEIATADELGQLEPGFPLALAGYPTERIRGAEVQTLGPTPTFSSGMVTAITDEFNLPADFRHRRLVRHNIPATGGSSGSPIVGPSGRVVAFHNSGNMIFPAEGGRLPSAALINYAQRADLVHDVLSSQSDEILERERQYWTEQTRTFKRGFDVLVPDILRRARFSGEPVLVYEERFALSRESVVDLTDGNGNLRRDDEGRVLQQRQQRHSLRLSAGTPYVLIAYALNSAFIELYLMVNGRIEGSCGPQRSKACQNDQDAWYPSLSYTPPLDITADVYVVGASESDTTYTLLQYGWGAPVPRAPIWRLPLWRK
jgi:hypothetical protein